MRYRYPFARPGNPEGRWWQRERVDGWLPPLAANNPRLIDFLKGAGWLRQLITRVGRARRTGASPALYADLEQFRSLCTELKVES